LWPMWNRISAQCLEAANADGALVTVNSLRHNFKKQLVAASSPVGKESNGQVAASWLSSNSTLLNLANITLADYRARMKLESTAFRKANNSTANTKARMVEQNSGVIGESPDAFKLLTLYAATGKANAHKRDRAVGAARFVVSTYNDWAHQASASDLSPNTGERQTESSSNPATTGNGSACNSLASCSRTTSRGYLSGSRT
jgi:hypothetical protein